MNVTTSLPHPRVLALLAALAAAGACGGGQTPDRATEPGTSEGPRETPTVPDEPQHPTAPLSTESSEPSDVSGAAGVLDSLAVAGHGDAILWVPASTDTPRPVVLAAHGAGDTPTWQCRIWGDIVGNRGFVVCPRGTPMGWLRSENMGFFFRNHHALEKEALAVLGALRTRFGRRLAPGPVVYAGYSQGATMGALMVVKHPSIFSRVVLIEGGEGEWDVPTAMRFHQGGGERVLFVCGRFPCAQRARQSLGWLRRGKVLGREEYVRGAGHTYGGPVADRLVEVFDWVVGA